MAALNLDGFSTPVNNFAGLHKLADSSRETQYRNDQLRERKEGKKAATAAWLESYLNPKDFLTGTNYDPLTVEKLSKLLQSGIGLVNEGADKDMLLMALSPGVAEINHYTTNAKLLDSRIKEQMALVPNKSGFDKSEWEARAKRLAFYGEGKELKDPRDIDINTDWSEEALQMYPDEITTDEGIDQFVKGSQKVVNTVKMKRKNAYGGYESRNTKVTAPAWSVLDKDEKEVVPRYELAFNEGKPLTQTYKNEKGEEVTEQVKLLDEKEYDNIVSSDRSIKHRLRGWAKKAGINDIESPEGKRFARSVLFQELNRRKGVGLEDIVDIKANPAPTTRITNNINLPKSDQSNADMGNEFDKAGMNLSSESTWKEGKIYDKSGQNLITGEIWMKGHLLPANITAILKKAGADISGATDIEMDVQAGKVQRIRPSGGQWIDRDFMANAQLGDNSEPQKAQQKKYGVDSKKSAKMDDKAYEEFLKKNGLKK